MINNNEFLEYAKVYNNYYGTPAAFVQDHLEKGNDVLLEIDIQGAMQIKKISPRRSFYFIQPPSVDDLESRLNLRGKDSPESIQNAYRPVNGKWISIFITIM